MGLKTELLQDVGREAMSAAIARFGSALQVPISQRFISLVTVPRGPTIHISFRSTLTAARAQCNPSSRFLRSSRQCKVLSPAVLITAATIQPMAGANWRRNARLHSIRTSNGPLPRIQSQLSNTVLHCTGPRGPRWTARRKQPLRRRIAETGGTNRRSPDSCAQSAARGAGRDREAEVVGDNNTFSQPFALSGAAKPSPARRLRPVGAEIHRGLSNSPTPTLSCARTDCRCRRNSLHIVRQAIPALQKTGSFEFVNQTPVGPGPFLLIVMSVDQKGIAELVFATQNDLGRLWLSRRAPSLETA